MAQVQFRKVKGRKELEDVYRLRYKVYCEEWGFEKEEDHPDGMESDQYDEHAVHFAAVREGVVIGTLRLITNSEKGFPLERFTTVDEDLSHVDREKLGEISRLAVSKDFRKRARDSLLYSGQVKNPLPKEYFARKEEGQERRRLDLVTGLYMSVYVESKLLGLTHWYAVAAKGLYLLLARYGLVFSQIGPGVEYHGLRSPYLASVTEMERLFSSKSPDLWKEFEEALRAAGG